MIKILVFLLSWLRKVNSFIKQKVCSWLFIHITGASNESRIFPPFQLIGGEYVHAYGKITGASGLRIECISNWNGHTYSPSLFIGNNVTFNYRCHIGCVNKIKIGNNVLIGSNVLITDHSHGQINNIELSIPPEERFLYSKGPVYIHDNVWIGENVMILPDVSIGENAIIAAASVVTKSIPPNVVAAGNPAKVIRQL